MLASTPVPESAPHPRGGVQLPADFDAERDVLVLAGSGAAPYLSELRRLGIGRVVVFTPDAELLPGGARGASTAPDALAHILDFEPPARQITLQRLPAGIGDEQFELLKKTVEHGGMNRATFASSGPIWVSHALTNLPYLAREPSIDCLKDCFAGKPCVLVSPGPSLSKNIDVLKQLADRVLIIAGNRALAPLKSAGIVPHLVVVADAMDLSYQLGGGLLDEVSGLVLDLVAHPAVCALPVARRFFFSAIGEIAETTFDGLDQNGTLSSGGSVATVALTLALHLGAGPILMVGQDLALTGDQYYVPSAPDGGTRIELQDGVGTFHNSSKELRQAMHDVGGIKLDERSIQHFIKVPGYDGGEVYTSLQFDTYRRWFGGAALGQAGKRRIVNCTEGGARIEHVEQARLSEMAAQLPEAPIDAARVLADCHERQSQKARGSAVERHIKRLQTALHDALEEAQRCERISHQVQRAPGTLERLDSAERKLNDAVRKLPFVVALASAEVERARRAGANAKDLSQSLEATRALYAVIKQAVLFARPLLGSALQRVRKAA